MKLKVILAFTLLLFKFQQNNREYLLISYNGNHCGLNKDVLYWANCIIDITPN